MTPHLPPAWAQQLSIAKRHPAWLRMYPSVLFWKPWHMALLSHGSVVATPHAPGFMNGLYRTDTIHTDAARALLQFEARTVFGRLPGQTAVPESLLLGFVTSVASRSGQALTAAWPSLEEHYIKHAGAEELSSLRTAATATSQYAASLNVFDAPQLQEFFPERMDSQDDYLRLARAILLLSVMPERPFHFSLYCSRSEYRPHHALTLNVTVPLSFLAQTGSAPEREVKLGLTVASAEIIPAGQGEFAVPRLMRELSFATLYAPTPSLTTRMLMSGRSADLLLQ